LVVLLLGFAALTIHASMHTQPDQQSCELCSGHFNPFHAIAPAVQTPILASHSETSESVLPQFKPSRSFSFFRQRAPPVLD
jgi:hypothetical protein